MKVKAEFNPFRGILLLLIFTVCGLKSFAQTDTEFWFVIPDVTYEHQSPGGEPANFTISTLDMPSRVTISMPANPSFTPIIIDIPANSAYIQSMSPFINTAVIASKSGNPDAENQYKTLPNPTNPTGVNKCGILITATTPISVYYQIANVNNTDLYALKGKNALGTKFYVPFQNLRSNHRLRIDHEMYAKVAYIDKSNNMTLVPTGILFKPSKETYRTPKPEDVLTTVMVWPYK